MKKSLCALLIIGALYTIGRDLFRSYSQPSAVGPILCTERLGLAGEFSGPLPGGLEENFLWLARFLETDSDRRSVLNGEKPQHPNTLTPNFKLWATYRETKQSVIKHQLLQLGHDGLFRLLSCFAAFSSIVFALIIAMILGKRSEVQTVRPKPGFGMTMTVAASWVCLNALCSVLIGRLLVGEAGRFALILTAQFSSYIILAGLLYRFWCWKGWKPWLTLDWGLVTKGYVCLLIGMPVLELAIERITGVAPNIQLSLLPYFRGLSISQGVVLALIAVLLGPLLEELLFRGFLLQSATAKLGTFGGIVVSSAIFALVHGNLWALPGPFFFGIVTATLAVRTNSLSSGYALHVLWNATTLCWLFCAL